MPSAVKIRSSKDLPVGKSTYARAVGSFHWQCPMCGQLNVSKDSPVGYGRIYCTGCGAIFQHGHILYAIGTGTRVYMPADRAYIGPRWNGRNVNVVLCDGCGQELARHMIEEQNAEVERAWRDDVLGKPQVATHDENGEPLVDPTDSK